MSARFGSEGLGAWVLDRFPALRTGRPAVPRGAGGRPGAGSGDGRAEVTVTTGPAVPASVLRALLVLVGGLLVVLTASSAPGGVLGAMLLLAGAPAWLPRWPTVALLLLAVGLPLLLGDPASPLVLACLVLLVHVEVRLVAVVARTSWRTRVETAVLRDDWRVAAAVQVAAQVLALVAGAAAGADGGQVWLVAGLVVVVALSAVALARPVSPWWRQD